MPSSSRTLKTATGKPDFSLLPLDALTGLVRVLEAGAAKYARDNWRVASDREALDRYRAALLRHTSGIQTDPAALDKEDGLPEIDHVIACAVILRGLLQLHHGLPRDPGEGKAPPSIHAEPEEVDTGLWGHLCSGCFTSAAPCPHKCPTCGQ